MFAPLLLQLNPPDLADFATWAAGRGLPAVISGALILFVTLVSLIRLAIRQRRATRFDDADDGFLAAFRDSAHVLALFQAGVNFQSSPRWQIYLASCRELAFHLIGSDRVEQNFAARLSAAGRISSSQSKAVRRAAQRAAEEIAIDFQTAACPATDSGSLVRWIGLVCGIIVLAEAALNPASPPDPVQRLLLPPMLPLAISVLLSLVVSGAARALIRRTTTTAARLRLFPAELAIMIDRAFVDHGTHPAELPSVASLGAPASPSFNLPPSDGFTRLAP